ncbi:MAG TPA: TonB-dependent siderophore receptor [Sphingomonadaceae bacterium]|nr:TonB-dependent siderophore receptor [Sphingomonadaceae bacterium]
MLRSDLRSRTAASSPAFLALGCVGFIATAASAQGIDQPQPDADKATRLGGVTVTGTAIDEQGYKIDRPASPKYTAPLLDTPKSVTILPAQVIQESGSTSLVEALRTVPGITFGAGEGGNPQGDRPFIRGFDAQGSTYVDGIRSTGGQSREIFAIDQIEVVKGSDSVMGGRGSAGGSLNIISKMAHLGTETEADLSYGTDDYKRATLDANYQIGDTAAVRLNAMWHDADVADRDVVTYNRWGISPSIAFGLDTGTRAYLNYYHLESDDIPDSGIPFERTQAQAVASGLLDIGPAEEVNGQKVARGNFYGIKDRDFRKTNVDEALFRFEHDFGDTLTVRNSAKYSNAAQSYILTQPDDSQGNVTNGKVWRRINSRYGFTESFADHLDLSGKFETGALRHSFSVGAEASWEQSRRGSYVVNTSPRCAAGTSTAEIGAGSNYNCTSLFIPDPDAPWVNYADDGVTPTPITRSPLATITEATTYSAYAFDTVTITDALLVNLGARYDHYDTRVRTRATATADESRLSRTDDLFTWQAGLIFKPAPNGSIYVSYATSATPPGSMLGEGSESSGLTPGRGQVAVSPDDLKVEKTKSYEIGTKWEMFDAALAVNLAAFRTETSNARTTDENGFPAFVGDRRIDGIELGFNGRILPFWSVFGGYTYMDSEVRFAGPDNANNGRPFPNTPKHSFTTWTTVNIGDQFTLGGGAIYNSRQYGGFGADGVTRSIPGYWRFDATASVRLTDNVTLRANVQNLFDKRYYDRTYSTHFVSIAPGRSAFATLSLKY